MSTFYQLPFRAGQAGATRRFERCDLATSVRQHLHLLLQTMPLSHRFAATYGSVLNTQHFRLPTDERSSKRFEQEIRDRVSRNLSFLIRTYEPRLRSNDVAVSIRLPTIGDNVVDKKRLTDVRLILDITIIGELLEDYQSRPFDFSETYALL